MAEYRTIKISFWNDPYIEELEPPEKLLYLYLFTSPHTNNIGILEVTTKKIAFETGLSVQAVNNGLAKLEKSQKVVRDGQCIFVVRFIKNQTSTSPKLIQSMRGIAKTVTSEKIQKALSLLYPDIFEGVEYPIDTLSIPYQDGTDTVGITPGEKEEEREREIEKEREEEESTRARKKAAPAKISFGENGNVKLTQEEHDKLCEKYGADLTEKAIAFLDLHIGAKGKDVYKSHNLAMQKWVFDAVIEREAKMGRTQSPPSYATGSNGRSRYVRESEQSFDNLPMTEEGLLDWSKV